MKYCVWNGNENGIGIGTILLFVIHLDVNMYLYIANHQSLYYVYLIPLNQKSS